jgi:hypothetical protein
MDAPFEKFYSVDETEVWVLFDVRIAGAAKKFAPRALGLAGKC